MSGIESGEERARRVCMSGAFSLALARSNQKPVVRGRGSRFRQVIIEASLSQNLSLGQPRSLGAANTDGERGGKGGKREVVRRGIPLEGTGCDCKNIPACFFELQSMRESWRLGALDEFSFGSSQKSPTKWADDKIVFLCALCAAGYACVRGKRGGVWSGHGRSS